jgi:hypothetical protein
MEWKSGMCGRHKLWSGNLKGRDHLGDLCIDEMITLKWILKNQVLKMWTGFKWNRIESNSRLL